MEPDIKNCKGCGEPPEYQEILTKSGPRYVILCHKCQKSSLSIVGRVQVIRVWNMFNGVPEVQ
jgi:hypothetical protein